MTVDIGRSAVAKTEETLGCATNSIAQGKQSATLGCFVTGAETPTGFIRSYRKPVDCGPAALNKPRCGRYSDSQGGATLALGY